jgi:TonB family protein
MKPFALRLAVALLTFFVGITLAALWYTNRPASEEVEVMVAPPMPQVTIRPLLPGEELPPPPPPAPLRPNVIQGGVLQSKAVVKPQPAYPAIAKAARAQGTVVVQVVIDEAGYVESARAVSGHPLLQQTAVEAARQARFSPTLLSGRPIKVSGVVTYQFVLQ